MLPLEYLLHLNIKAQLSQMPSLPCKALPATPRHLKKI